MTSKLQYSEQQMLSALEAVKKGMNIAAAGKLYGVPRTTLADKHRGRVPIKRKMGPETLLSSAEESQIVQWMFDAVALGFPVTKDLLLDNVKIFLCQINKSHLFPSGRPGRTWYESFLKRHPEVSNTISHSFSKSRDTITEELLQGWFKDVSDYFASNNLSSILLDPRRSFSSDEVAFFLTPKDNNAIVRKGDKTPHNFNNSNERECLTSLLTGNAAGELAPPMIIFSYKRVPSDVAGSMPKKWSLGLSETGWMTGDTFYQYIANIFHPWLLREKIPLPVILYLDKCTSHLTMTVSNYCRDNQIILVALHTSSRILQPLDSMFTALKQEWRDSVCNWRMENNGERLTRRNFPPLLESTINNCNLLQTLQNGFHSCGLHPFSPDSIDFTKLPQLNKSANTRMMDIDNVKYHLKFLECSLPSKKVEAFKSSGSSWSGNIEDKSLFDYWLSLKMKTNEIEDDNFKTEEMEDDNFKTNEIEGDNFKTNEIEDDHFKTEKIEDLEESNSEDVEYPVEMVKLEYPPSF